MSYGEDVIRMTNDYMAGRVKLSVLAEWMMDHVEDFALAQDDDVSTELADLVQVRIFDMEHGFTEDELRSAVRAFLEEHKLMAAGPQRAAG